MELYPPLFSLLSFLIQYIKESIEYKIPLGLCKQAFMKLESFSSDIREIIEEEDLDPIDRENLPHNFI